MLLGGWIFIFMGKKTRKNTIITKIAVATFIAVFSLASAFAGTIAWFSSTSSATVTGGSFTVQTPTGVGFSLYFLEKFSYTEGLVNKFKDGDYNSIAREYTGYETTIGNALFKSTEDNDVQDEDSDEDEDKTDSEGSEF